MIYMIGRKEIAVHVDKYTTAFLVLIPCSLTCLLHNEIGNTIASQVSHRCCTIAFQLHHKFTTILVARSLVPPSIMKPRSVLSHDRFQLNHTELVVLVARSLAAPFPRWGVPQDRYGRDVVGISTARRLFWSDARSRVPRRGYI